MREIFSPILYSKLGLEGFDQQIKLLRWTGENFSPYFKLSLEGFAEHLKSSFATEVVLFRA